MDCGAACLGDDLPPPQHSDDAFGKLRELAQRDHAGATLDSLARAGESLGFTTRGVQCTLDALRRLRTAVHRALGRLSLCRWCTASRRAMYGWPIRPSASARLRYGGVRARLERHLPAVSRRGESHDRKLAVRVRRGIRFIGYLSPYRSILGAPVPGDVRDPGARVWFRRSIIQNILDGVVVHQNVGLLHLLILGAA